ncbi:FtsK/SpoIIIE domain-containing protein [Streptomyces sp. 7N604]|uniref:FtsK/SpoIIIE domain-containing protein n=1 Tax=Streptomyces sp. 7N604 TaxID=3457415 RepID=UPI003FD61061
MQIRLTVLGPRGGHAARACDVLVTAPAGTALAAVASGLAAAVAATARASDGAGPAGVGGPEKSWAEGADSTAGGSSGSSGPVVLYAGGERLDAQRCALGEPPLTDGAVLSLNAPAAPGRHPGVPQEAPSDASVQLHVVAGPDAGGVHLLHSGRISIGRSADADVPLDDPDVSRLHCAVTVADDGHVTVADLGSTNGTALDGTPLDSGPAPFRPGALLRVGESALRLVGAERSLPGAEPPADASSLSDAGSLSGAGSPSVPAAGSGAGASTGGGRAPLPDVLPTAPDGEGHLRVGLRGRPSPEAVPGAAGPVAGAATRHAGQSAPGAEGAGSGGPGSRAPAGAPYAPGRQIATAAAGQDDFGHTTSAPHRPARTTHVWGTGGQAGPPPVGPSASAPNAHAPGRTDQPPADDYPEPDRAEHGPGAPGTRHGARQHPAPGTAAPFAPGTPPPRPSWATGPYEEGGDPRTAPRSGPEPPVGGRVPQGSVPPPRAGGDEGERAPQGPPQQPLPPRGQAPGGAVTGLSAGDGQTPVPRRAANDSRGGARAGAHTGPDGAPYTGPYADPYAGGAGAETAGGSAVRGVQGPGTHVQGGGPWASDGATGAGRIPEPRRTGRPAEPPRRPTRWGRGIGAWARRLAAGRDIDEAAEPAPREAHGAERAPAEGPTAAYERWPDPAGILLTALGPGPRLWERGAGHPDALVVRLGTTDRPGAPATPVTVGLRETGSLGLAGPRARLAGLARSVVAQLAALHRPDDLEIVLISTDRVRSAGERLAEWSWLGWLPQLRPAHGQDCRLLLAYDRDQASARTTELVRRLDDGLLGPSWVTADRAAIAAASRQYDGPRTVVIVDGDPGSAALRGTTARLAAGGPVAGIHLLCLADTPAASPASPLTATFEAACTASPPFSECGAAGLLSGDVATALRVMPLGPAGPLNNGVVAGVDAVSAAWAERFARALAPLRAADAPGAATASGSRRVAAPLPRTARLLDELGLARATPASLMARWAAATDAGPATDAGRAADASRAAGTSRVAGASRVTEDGRVTEGGRVAEGGRAWAVLGAGPHGPLAADLTAEGPHLLIEGGRGTGKTELLRSLAASLAAADRPDRVSLALVDGGGAERGEGLQVCTDLPHVSTYLAASDPVRMREFAQALSTELKRRAELLGGLGFDDWHRQRAVAARLVTPRRSTEQGTYGGNGTYGGSGGNGGNGGNEGNGGRGGNDRHGGNGGHPAADRRAEHADDGDAESAPSGTLKLRAADPAAGGAGSTGPTPLPRLVVLVDDFDELVAPGLGSPGRPAAGSVVRALEAVARDGARLGVHLIAATGRPHRTAGTAAAAAGQAGLRITLDVLTTRAEGPDAGEASAGRGRLVRGDGSQTPFQAGRVTGRIPRTATQRPTVVPLDWERMGDPPTRRPLRELGNGPTDLALLASALQRAAAQSTPPAEPLRLP